MDTWTEPVDGKQKVCFCLLFSAWIKPNRVITMENKPLSRYVNVTRISEPCKHLSITSNGRGDELCGGFFIPPWKYLNFSSFPHFLKGKMINMHAQNIGFLFSVTPVRSFPLCWLTKGVAGGKIGVIEMTSQLIKFDFSFWEKCA